MDVLLFPTSVFQGEQECKGTPLPLFAVPVSAGFPSPADGFIESRLDLNEHCIRNPTATYFARIEGDGWSGLNLSAGDQLIVDRSLCPVQGSLVVADLDGKRTLFRAEKTHGFLELIDGNEMRYGPEWNAAIWGVVTYIIRKVR